MTKGGHRVPRTRCGGRWTEARYSSFIKNQLRSATRKWAPIQDCKRSANVRRGFYLCANCVKHVPSTKKVGNKRVNNVIVDHISPIVPVTGWVGWDDYVESMFCEEGNLQLLCKKCSDSKTKQEQNERAKHRRNTNGR